MSAVFTEQNDDGEWELADLDGNEESRQLDTVIDGIIETEK